MGLFDSKQAVVTPVNTTNPQVAECDARLAALVQKKKNAIYQVGELFVQTNSSSTVEGTVYQSLWDELLKIEAEANALEVRKLAVQGLRKCGKCGYILALDSVFCNKCGEKQEPIQGFEGSSQPKCPGCGASYSAGAAFCTNCGTKLN